MTLEAFPSSVRATAHVYVERLDDDVAVDGDDAHHLLRVLRVRDGETVTAADGHGRWRAYRMAKVDAPVVSLHATTELAHEPRLLPELSVVFALTKGERPELVVQKLTELGVDGIVLVRAARSVVRWDDSRAATALARLGRVAREAGVQCRRARLPVLDGPVTVDALALAPGLVVADPGGVGPDAVPAPRDGAWIVAVGPEGGFDDDERGGVGRRPPAAPGTPRVAGRDRGDRGRRGPDRAPDAGNPRIRTRRVKILPPGWYSARRKTRLRGAVESMDGPYVGERLRAIRRQKGLSLHDVEARSNQEFKASVLGAYERGERAISVPRLLRLAELYRVPPDQLLPRSAQDAEIDLTDAALAAGEGFTIDLVRLHEIDDEDAAVIARYAATIQLQRQDFNGQMLTIRNDDLRVLAAVMGHSPEELGTRLESLGLRAAVS